MRRVAEDRTVLFVNSIGMRMPLPGRSPGALRRIVRKAAEHGPPAPDALPDVPGFHVLTPFVLPFYGSRLGRTVNAWAVRAQVARAERSLGIDRPLVVVTIPTAWEVVRRLPHRSLVFNRSDKHSAFDEVDRAYIGSLEQALLEEADHVLYVSHALMAEEAETAGERAISSTTASTWSCSAPASAAEEPADLRDIPHPRIGFFGGFDDYVVDFDLLEQLAREVPGGPSGPDRRRHLPDDPVDGLPNVHWLGYRPYEEIPRYGSGFDVALMPWLDNEWIRLEPDQAQGVPGPRPAGGQHRLPGGAPPRALDQHRRRPRRLRRPGAGRPGRPRRRGPGPPAGVGQRRLLGLTVPGADEAVREPRPSS